MTSQKKSKTRMFETCVFDHSVKVLAKHVGSNLGELLTQRVRIDLEGKCGPQGYVLPGSIKIIYTSKGELIDIDFGKSYLFNMKIKCEICNPLPGLRFKAIVQANNKIGILAEGGFFDNLGNLVPVLEVVVIKETVMLQNEVPTEDLVIGDEVNIEVLGRVYELNDTRVRAFGRTVISLGENTEITLNSTDASGVLLPLSESGDGGEPGFEPIYSNNFDDDNNDISALISNTVGDIENETDLEVDVDLENEYGNADIDDGDDAEENGLSDIEDTFDDGDGDVYVDIEPESTI